jgi:hypothetical protein
MGMELESLAATRDDDVVVTLNNMARSREGWRTIDAVALEAAHKG